MFPGADQLGWAMNVSLAHYAVASSSEVQASKRLPAIGEAARPDQLTNQVSQMIPGDSSRQLMRQGHSVTMIARTRSCHPPAAHSAAVRLQSCDRTRQLPKWQR